MSIQPDTEEERFSSANLDNFSQILSNRPLRDLNPTLIAAFRERSTKRTPSDLMKDYDSKGEFYGPSSIDQRDLLEYSLWFYSVLPDRYRAIELAPIMPFALNTAISKIASCYSKHKKTKKLH